MTEIQKWGQPKVGRFANICDIEVPEQMKVNIPTGLVHIDKLFTGTGVTPSTATLITGVPGSGKTTLMLQLADSITGRGHVSLYNTTEESLFQVKRVVDRLHLSNGFIPGYNGDVREIIKHAKEVRRHYPNKQLFLFVDSLQTVYMSNDESNKKKRGRPKKLGEVDYTSALTKFAKDTYSIVFIIGGSTKSGEFAGKQAIRHVVDCHLHLGFDTGRGSETYGERVAEMQKNRFGPAGFYYGFELESRGLVFKIPSPIDTGV